MKINKHYDEDDNENDSDVKNVDNDDKRYGHNIDPCFKKTILDEGNPLQRLGKKKKGKKGKNPIVYRLKSVTTISH